MPAVEDIFTAPNRYFLWNGTTLVETTAQAIALAATQPVNAQTGTTYTFVLADANKCVTFSNASAVTATVPPHSSVAYDTNARIDLRAIGTGQVTIAPGSGVTIEVAEDAAGVDLFEKKLSGQWAEAALVYQGSDVWVLTGVLEAA